MHCPKNFPEDRDKPVAEDSLGDRYWGEVYGQCVCPQQDTPGHPLLTHLPRLPHTLCSLSTSPELTQRKEETSVWGDIRGQAGVWCMDSVSCLQQTHLGTTSSPTPQGKSFTRVWTTSLIVKFRFSSHSLTSSQLQHTDLTPSPQSVSETLLRTTLS